MSADLTVEPTETCPGSSATNRRNAERVRILQRCLVKPVDSPGSVSWKGIAYDLSARGIGLALPYPLAVGTSLVIEPAGLPAARPLRARVVRLHPVSYLWFCGCELAGSLRNDEIRAWLRLPVQLQGLPDTLPELALPQ